MPDITEWFKSFFHKAKSVKTVAKAGNAEGQKHQQYMHLQEKQDHWPALVLEAKDDVGVISGRNVCQPLW